MVGTNNISTEKVDIFPNPSKDWINVQIHNLSAFEQVELFDLNGQLLHSQSIQSANTKLQINDLASAVYFLKLSGNKGVLTRKILVQ